MATDSAVAQKNTTEGSTSQFVLLFELEGAAVDGRTKLFEAAKSVFQKSGVKLNDRQFARYCTHGAVPGIVRKLVDELGDGKLNDNAAETIIENYHDSMKGGPVHIHPLFTSIIKETNKRGIQATAISILPEEVATSIIEKSGLASQGVSVHSFAETERHFPRVDCWMKVCRQVTKSPRTCIAIAGSRDSGKSALSSGMRCIVVPDQFTSFQDFSGVDAVMDGNDDHPSLSELIDALT
jgi:beta-phosphoglucomutase-like phosphatase (HAD superfamily)